MLRLAAAAGVVKHGCCTVLAAVPTVCCSYAAALDLTGITPWFALEMKFGRGEHVYWVYGRSGIVWIVDFGSMNQFGASVVT